MPTNDLLKRWLPTTIGLGVLLLAALVAIWPSWTLRYVDALAWPVVAIGALALLGPALARRVPSLSALELPGGVVARFDQQPVDFQVAEFAELEPRDDLAGAAEVEQGQPLTVEAATEAVQILGVIVGAFQIQLDFLQLLADAEGGLNVVATRQWASATLLARGKDPDTFGDLDQVPRWLIGQGAAILTPTGNYEITEFGRKVLWALTLPGLFIAAKAV